MRARQTFVQESIKDIAEASSHCWYVFLLNSLSTLTLNIPYKWGKWGSAVTACLKNKIINISIVDALSLKHTNCLLLLSACIWEQLPFHHVLRVISEGLFTQI